MGLLKHIFKRDIPLKSICLLAQLFKEMCSLYYVLENDNDMQTQIPIYMGLLEYEFFKSLKLRRSSVLGMRHLSSQESHFFL